MSNETSALAPGHDLLAEIMAHKRTEVALRKSQRPAAELADFCATLPPPRGFERALRAKIARERRVPAYVIFTDRTLIDMAAKRPLTRWDFGEVHGVGESKLQQFAEIFLAEIRAFVESGSA